MLPSTSFQYDQLKLEKCAEEQSSAIVSIIGEGTATSTTTRNNNQKESTSELCHELLQEYQSFYKRSSKHKQLNSSGRFESFLKSVIFVYRHNYQKDQKDGTKLSSSNANGYHSHGHNVTLNQFSDLFDYELPFAIKRSNNQQKESPSTDKAAKSHMKQIENSIDGTVESSPLTYGIDRTNDAIQNIEHRMFNNKKREQRNDDDGSQNSWSGDQEDDPSKRRNDKNQSDKHHSN